MGVRRGKPLSFAVLACVVVAAAVALAVAGCGGSGSSSAERTKLAKEVSSQLEASDAPSDLTGCVSGESRGLPIAQLREVASAGSNPAPATKQLDVRLIVTCIKQGHGIGLMHVLITKAILSGPASTLPTAVKDCIVSKADATTPAQLVDVISAYAAQNQAAEQSRAIQLGEAIGARCVAVPGAIAAFRAAFIAPIRRELRTTSSAFRNCVMAKAEQLPAAQLERFAVDSPAAAARARAFGGNAARACIASGAKP